MGKKKGWFSAVKKALSPQSKKDQKSKSKEGQFVENSNSDAVSLSEPVNAVVPPPPPRPPVEESNHTEPDIENQDAYSVAVATAAAANAAVAAAQAAAEVVRLTTIPRFAGKSNEEIAAIKIQTAFRGYLARRALQALRGLVRLKSMIQGQSVKRQAATTLRCMQTLARVQSQVRARRVRMLEENQALQRQLHQKHEKDMLKMGENWDDTTQSKEQIEASLQSRQEAAMRRERALAYAFTHQQQTKKNSKHSNPTFMDPNNPNWGWSWMERWMAARPWETKSTTTEKELNENGSLKSTRTLSIAGEINRAYALRDLSLDNKPSPTGQTQRSSRTPSRQSPSTPTTRPPFSVTGFGKPKPESPRGNRDDDTKSMMSVQSERNRRHSITGGSSVRGGDNDSLASFPSVPSYMVPTKSVKAKTKLPSPLGVVDKNETPDDQKQPVGSAKKRLSFPASPGGGGVRRHSVPGKIESNGIKEVTMQPEEILVSN